MRLSREQSTKKFNFLFTSSPLPPSPRREGGKEKIANYLSRGVEKAEIH
jgi:hypothetical protein